MIIYLYVKQHSITGLKYFGKTKRNPFTYNGSGTRWSNHIKKHGSKFITTIEIWGFDDQSCCTDFALRFSEENDIVKSADWANLKPEDALDGGKTMEWTEEKRLAQSNRLKGRIWSVERNIKMANSKRGKKRQVLECPHCGKIGGDNNMSRWHFDNCKWRRCSESN